MADECVHGYEDAEGQRLRDQAGALADWLHADARYGAGERVLEIGCGVGAQTLRLARNNPGTRFVAVDISESSLSEAEAAARRAGLDNVEFRLANIFAPPFEAGAFDHVFLCFVLEHLVDPVAALVAARRMLKAGGSAIVTEGDHGSTLFHPDSALARRAIQCQVDLQAQAGGDANIGRRLYPLLVEAGFEAITVAPRIVYVDGSRPDLAEGFTRRTYSAMIAGVRERAMAAGFMTGPDFDLGIEDLRRAAQADGVFVYTFFQARARAVQSREEQHLVALHAIHVAE